MRLDFDFLNELAERARQTVDENKNAFSSVEVKQRTQNRGLSYNRWTGHFVYPEYDFGEIQKAQDTEGYVLRAIKKKTERLYLAGYEIVSENQKALDYINRRLREIGLASNNPFSLLIMETAHDLFRYNNCMWAKTRETKIAPGARGKINGYFTQPFESLQFKTNKHGVIQKIRQELPSGETKEWLGRDVIHFYTNKKPGFLVGTPELFPAIDDVVILRRIEENVLDLIETHLFPIYHYQIGTDNMPERYGPDGRKETDIVKQKVEYMTPGSVYISDHRHKIDSIGAESKALRIEAYLEYFKKRLFSTLGVSAVDMGEGTGATQSTANTLSKNLIMDIEAVQAVLKEFIDFFVINELLEEGGFNILDPANKVEIKFGVVDKEARMAAENQVVQLWLNNLLTHAEARIKIGEQPFTDEQLKDLYQKKMAEPLALSKAMAPGSAAGHVLAANPLSNVDPSAIKKEEQFAHKQQQTAKADTRGGHNKKNGAANQSKNRSKPSNQHGSRSAPKLNRDFLIYNQTTYNFDYPETIDDTELANWKALVVKRYELLEKHGISFDTVVENLLPRLTN